MDQKQLKQILENVRDGNMSVDEACLKVREAPYTDIGYARIDNHRALRQGCAEVIYGAGKTAEQILGISMTMKERGVPCILITRISPEKELLLRGRFEPYRYDGISRTAIIGKMPEADGMGQIVVATGGTSDIPVSEEAALTAEALGNKVLRLYDVGVSGLHRLLDHLDDLMSATVIIAVAGMEGALASVVGGLVSCPVVGVPTSVGYGANFGGLSAMLSMLNSCASGVSIVNIDNGFGAGVLASRINHQTYGEWKR